MFMQSCLLPTYLRQFEEPCLLNCMQHKHSDKPLLFTGSNSWHTYALLFITAYVTYRGMLPIHCMQASLWSNAVLTYHMIQSRTINLFSKRTI